MRQVLAIFALLFLAAAPPSAAAPVEGRWTNPKRSVILEVGRCGDAWCGTVVWATAKAKANARKGGTENLIGTRLVTGAKPIGDGVYRGRGFVPKQNIHSSATIRQTGPNTMLVKGCALAGLLCKEQRWTRVSS